MCVLPVPMKHTEQAKPVTEGRRNEGGRGSVSSYLPEEQIFYLNSSVHDGFLPCHNIINSGQFNPALQQQRYQHGPVTVEDLVKKRKTNMH